MVETEELGNKVSEELEPRTKDLMQNSEDRGRDYVMACPDCGRMTMRRERRFGWLEKKFLSKLGFYPWECSLCRERMYFRYRGKMSHPTQDSNQ